jgi:uncharacterized protein (DUF2235 family)
MKNIVICCDGTNNQLEGDLTNVVRLFQICKNDASQTVFYDPGVGTMADSREKSALGKRWSMFEGLAVGAGLDENVWEAYRFLMRDYESGDRVFLFGFSRGAFTIRVLAGMLHSVGLLRANAENLLPYLWRHYRSIKTSMDHASEETLRLRRSFTRDCPVHFLGPWDTVGSVGMYNRNQAFPFSFENSSVHIVRHAVSLDERRAAFRSNVFKSDMTPVAEMGGRPRVMNVWFPGVHSDVGGGYPESESGLAMGAFAWMVREATQAGLSIEDAEYKRLLATCPPNHLGTKHESLVGLWNALEYIPARRFNWKTHTTGWRYEPKKPRTMIESPFIHRSVRDRMRDDATYRPANLPENDSFPTED